MNIRVWRSLVSRLNGVQEASSSNLDTRTKIFRKQLILKRISCFHFKKVDPFFEIILRNFLLFLTGF